MVYQLVSLVLRLFDVYSFLIIAWCLLSWVPMRPGGFASDVRGALSVLVEPYLSLFQRFIPPVMGVDFSPVVAIFVLNVLERLLVTILL